MNNIITGLLVATIRMSTPLMLGALGEVFVERTGVMNIAIEGIFLMGAWGGFVGAYLTGKLWVGFLFAIMVGVFCGAVYGYFTIKSGKKHINPICRYIQLMVEAAGIEPASEDIAT